MPRELMIGGAAGMAGGMLFAAGVVGGGGAVLLIYVAMLPLLLAGLALGVRAALVGVAAGSLAVLAGAGVTAAAVFVALAGLPAVQVAQFALISMDGEDGGIVWYPFGRLLVWLAALGMVLMASGLLAMPHGPEGIEAAIRSLIVRMVEMLAGGIPVADRDGFAKAQAALFPAGATVGWLIMVIGNGLAAQAILVRSGRALRPMPRLDEFDLPNGAVWLLAVPGAGMVLGGDVGYICRNLAMVALVPPVFLGFAAMHRIVAPWPSAGLARVGFYGAFLAGSAKAVLAVAALGLVEMWARHRENDPGPGADEEDE